MCPDITQVLAPVQLNTFLILHHTLLAMVILPGKDCVERMDGYQKYQFSELDLAWQRAKVKGTKVLHYSGFQWCNFHSTVLSKSTQSIQLVATIPSLMLVLSPRI